MKYPRVTHRSSGGSAVDTERRTRLVAPSPPIRKSDCTEVSRVDNTHFREFRSMLLTRLLTNETPAFSASSKRYLPSSRRETTATGSFGVTVTERLSPK